MKLFTWLQSFLSEESGKGSSRRIIELVVAWVFAFSYVKVALSTQTLPPLDMGWVVMLCGLLGIKVADKYFQSKNGVQSKNVVNKNDAGQN